MTRDAQNDSCITQFTLRSQKKEVSDQNTMFIGKIKINPKPRRLGIGWAGAIIMMFANLFDAEVIT